MLKNLIYSLIVIFCFNIEVNADEKQSFPGLISSDVFDMGNGMDMHIERRKTFQRFDWCANFNVARK